MSHSRIYTILYGCFILKIFFKAGFGYDNSVSLQTDDAGYVAAAVLANVSYVVGLQTNDVLRN